MEESVYYETEVVQRPVGVKDWVRAYYNHINHHTNILHKE